MKTNLNCPLRIYSPGYNSPIIYSPRYNKIISVHGCYMNVKHFSIGGGRLLSPKKIPELTTKEVRDWEDELTYKRADQGSIIREKKDLTGEYKNLPPAARVNYLSVSEKMRDKVIKFGQTVDELLRMEGTNMQRSGLYARKQRSMEKTARELKNMEKDRNNIKDHAWDNYENDPEASSSHVNTGATSNSNITTLGSTDDLSSVAAGKRKQRTETPELEPKKPRFDRSSSELTDADAEGITDDEYVPPSPSSKLDKQSIAQQAMAKNPRFTSSSALDESEISSLLSAGFFGYFSSVNLHILSPLISSPYFPIIYIGFIMVSPFVWLIYLYRVKKKGKKAWFKSSK